MNNLIKVFFFISIAFASASCTKIVDIDLNEANPKVVIDGSLNFPDSSMSYAVVRLSWTGSFYSSNDFSTINNAHLYLESPDGIIHTLVNNSDGQFISTDSISGNSYDSYKLFGDINGEEFSAVSSLPRRVVIDSIGAYVFPFGPPNNGEFRTPVCFFTDLPNEKNYYRYRLFVNGKQMSELFFSRDDGQDGSPVAYPFFRAEVLPNDTINIELLSIDKESFDYYKVLSQNIGSGGFSAAPGNPITNISGSPIGIFTVQTVSRKTIIVK